MRFRPTTNIFIFTSQFRPFARCFVRVFSSFPGAREPQRKREMHAFRCCRRQWPRTRVLVSSFPYPHPLAYQLASPECSVRDIKSNFPPLPLFHEKLQTFFFLRAKNEETSSPLLPNWPKPWWYSNSSRLVPPPQFLTDSETIPFDRLESESAYRMERTIPFSFNSSNKANSKHFYIRINFPRHGRNFSRSSKLCNFLLTFTKSRTNNRIIRSLDRAAKEEKRGGENFRIQNSVNVTWLLEDLSRGSGRELWRGVETRERAGRSRPIKWAAGRYLSWPAMRLPRTSL